MSTAFSYSRPWDHPDYDQIARADFDEERHMLTVSFDDGSVVTLNPDHLVPSTLNDIDWWRVAVNRIELIVPHSLGWFEVPWDVLRRASDPAYAEYWSHLFDKPNVRVVREDSREFPDEPSSQS